MIRVSIHKDLRTVANVVIKKIGTSMGGELADYSVTIMVERGNDVLGIHKKVLEGFPRNSLNTVALLKAALNLFDEDTLGLEDDLHADDTPETEAALPSTLERKVGRALRSIQGGKR